MLPKLIIITDWTLQGPDLTARLRPVLGLGQHVAIQHRHPGVAIRQFVEEGRRLAELCRAASVPLFINGRLDVALLLGAHLHLPAGALLPADVRPHLPPERWVSCAVHSEEEGRDAVGADLAVLSPVFSPRSKPGDHRPPLTPAGFSRLAKGLAMPAYALGGIGPDSAASVEQAHGFAVVGSVLHSRDPRDSAERILARVHV